MNKLKTNYLISYLKKVILFVVVLALTVCLTGCEEQDELVLRVYSWEDYIDDGTDDNGIKIGNSVMEDFEEWYFEKYGVKVIVEYDTFATNEVMMNTLKTGKTSYDLICPSDYTIQKMIGNSPEENMLEEFDYTLRDQNGDLIIDNYKYLSPYLRNLFEEKGWDKYSIPYMWGTLGLIYNPEVVDHEDAKHWNILWDEKYKNQATAKDSVRDTYVIGVMEVYYDELMELREKYLNNEISQKEYSAHIQEIMNRCDDPNDPTEPGGTLEKIERALKDMKNNLYGFEVDNGKSDIVTGKIAINFAWSGDAVYSLDTAEYDNEEEPVYLYYSVPEEGSNVWFDGWVMPKGANKKLAQSFVNYLCSPEMAVRNMNFIGYTSGIIGDEVLDMINEWYGVLPYYYEDEEDPESTGWYFDGEILDIDYSADSEPKIIPNSNGENLYDIYINDTLIEEEVECYEVSLNHYFENADQEILDSIKPRYLKDGKVTVYVWERDRQFDTQYPSMEVLARCAIMEDFGTQNNAVMDMWENVKIGDIPFSITIIVIILLSLGLGALYTKRIMKARQKAKRRKIIE